MDHHLHALLVISLLTFWVVTINANRGDIPQPRNLPEESNFCAIHTNCSACLQNAGCAWCSSQDFLLNGQALARCNPSRWFPNFNNLHQVRCNQVEESTDSGEIRFVQDEFVDQNGRVRQIRPQRIRIRTSPHKPASVSLKFTRVAGYPVDLYYIMDLSTSMQDDKENLEKLTNSLAQTMKNITSDFRMGFGSFIDKPIAPFVNEAQINNNASYRPYLFRNHLKLSEDATSILSAQVRQAKTYDNLDLPEGGLEALMQAVVCTNQIGWRNESHRLIILSTDGPYHLAGDGKLAGITVPNDERCHTSNENQNSFSFLQQDYPSVAQISRQITQNSMNVIFAVTEPVAPTYRALSSRILGSSVGELLHDSGNIVRLIEEQYNKITSSVVMSHRASDAVQITYESSCLSNDPPKRTNRCDKVKKGSLIEFNVTLTATKCRDGRNFREEIQLTPVGVNEALIIELEVICQCPCDVTEPSNGNNNDERCSKEGKYLCGVCECNRGFSGPLCECNERNPPNPDSKGCKPSNSAIDFPDCSGRGTCQCGELCLCHSVPGRNVSGDFCECDDFDCPMFDGKVCSGPDHGSCPCNSGGRCECKPGWKGDSCECPDSEEGCVHQPGAPKCSIHGNCICNKCYCERTDDGPYTGEHCEISPTRCEELKDCVRCKAFEIEPEFEKDPSVLLTKEDCNQCPFNVNMTDVFDEMGDEDRLCSVVDENNCKFYFVYNRLELGNFLQVQRNKECTELPNVVAIASGVSGAILAIGLLLLLLWKILTTIHDRIEYAKFQRDRALARWDRGDNPIYKRPTTLFLNPAYASSNEGD